MKGKFDGIEFARNIQSFRTLRKSVEAPKHLFKKDAVKTGKEFNLNRYFKIFQSIKVEPSQVLDWVYFKTELG